MAFIEKRGHTWRAQVRRKGAPSISRTFDLRAEAKVWAQEIERELRRGNNAIVEVLGKHVTFDEVAKHYALNALPALKSKKTAIAFLKRAQEKFGETLITSIRSTDVSTWRDEMTNSGVSPRSVAYALSVLSSTMTHASRELSIQLPAGNPVQLVRKPPASKGRDRRLRNGEFDALIAAARADKAPGLEQIITLAVETSMRLGELLSLEWSLIDLDARTAHLPVTKNGSSRTVALSSVAVAALSSLKVSATKRVFHWVASDSFEKAWTRCKVRAQDKYQEKCRAEGAEPDPSFLGDLRFHDLRHEATSRLFERGLGVMEVASMTGHKSLSMLKRYTHMEASRLAKKLG